MGIRGLALLLVFVLAGCTRVVDTPDSGPQIPVAPIAAAQIRDLLSSKVQGGEGNLFVTAEPKACSGIAQEVDPPFVFHLAPAATDGGHWVADTGGEVFIEELAGIYHADFEANGALADVKRTLDSCQGVSLQITSMQERTYDFKLLSPVTSDSSNIVLWSYGNDEWACDNAFIAAHNAAIEIATCSPVHGYDVVSLARDALKRIEALADNRL